MVGKGIENWGKLINSLSQDYTKEVEMIIAGSKSNLLSGELSTLLSGRYVQFLVLPLSFEEYVLFNQIVKYSSPNHLISNATHRKTKSVNDAISFCIATVVTYGTIPSSIA